MQPVTTRFAEWVDLAIELVRQPHVDFPRAAVAGRLAETFQAFVSWSWLTADGGFGYELGGPLPGYPRRADVEDLARASVRSHPLLRWYGLSREPTPMSLHRVPGRLRAARSWQPVLESLEANGLERQLAIPHRFDHRALGAFVVARGERDYTDAELGLARRIQPLLAMLDRQAEVLARAPSGARADPGLTGREVAVLQLLADGLTAVAIGHRLLVSERTVHAHLRSIYRKLGAADRVRAVLAAGELRVIRTDGTGFLPAGASLPGLSGQLRDLDRPHWHGLWATEPHASPGGPTRR